MKFFLLFLLALKLHAENRVFITGSAGFIGFHLSKTLKEKGDFVIGCDNFNPYYDPQIKRTRSEILKSQGIDIIEGDICDSALMEKIIEENNITHCVHLAAQAGVRHSKTKPEDYIHSNLVGFVRLLEVCRKFPKMKFIFASSSSVYGLNEKIPFAETDPTDHPVNLYAATKKADELLAFAYHHLYGISMIGLRFFTVYGPWGRPDMAYYFFTQKIMNGEPIAVFGDGSMKRDFTYVDDIVEGIISTLNYPAGFEIFNLGNNHPEEVSALIEIIEEKTGKKAIKQFLPAQPEEVAITYADLTKSEGKLGYRPKVSLREGMDRFITWIQSDKEDRK